MPGRLSGQTALAAILHEDAAVDLALVNVRLLVAVVNDADRFGGLLEDADLELPSAAVVVLQGTRRGRKRGVAGGVVDLERAIVSECQPQVVKKPLEEKRGKSSSNSLLIVVQRDRKILPGIVQDGRHKNNIICTIQELPRLLRQPLLVGGAGAAAVGRVVLGEHDAGVDGELVAIVVVALVPGVHVLVREVHAGKALAELGAGLARAPVEGDDALVGGVGAVAEQEARAAEAELHGAAAGHEQRLVRDGDLDGLGGVAGGGEVEARGLEARVVRDLRPGEVLALGVVGIEGGGVGVQILEREGGRDAAVEDDGAFHRGRLGRKGRSQWSSYRC